ncbi:MAG: hypothetical protein HRU19_07795 [Pseudobacteriovorax sp.]|nr:hypothetical protein [Pseudobacteriovorax sp.]
MEVTAKVPTRVDLAGGTLDLYPLYEVMEESPVTINFGISLYARATVSDKTTATAFHSVDQSVEEGFNWSNCSPLDSRLPLLKGIFLRLWKKSWPSIHLTTQCQSPAGAGLGGSSALGIAVASALNRMAVEKNLMSAMSEQEIVDLVQSVETKIIHCPAGVQDYWGAIRGRLNALSYQNGRVHINTLDGGFINSLDNRLVLCYSGVSRSSGINNWQIFKSVFDREERAIAQLNELTRLSLLAYEAIEKESLDELLEHSKSEWDIRKKLWPAVETEETKRIDAIIGKNTKGFSRVCGAGGGGVVAIFVPTEMREQSIKDLSDEGFQVLDGTIAREGITFYDC